MTTGVCNKNNPTVFHLEKGLEKGNTTAAISLCRREAKDGVSTGRESIGLLGIQKSPFAFPLIVFLLELFLLSCNTH